MKRIINGKTYNTETAKQIAWDSYSCAGDFKWWYEALFQKKTGEFFLYGEGGAMSRYSVSCGQNQWKGTSKIIPLTKEEAIKWSENHMTSDEYISVFGEPQE